jgi:hypothetical protein
MPKQHATPGTRKPITSRLVDAAIRRAVDWADRLAAASDPVQRNISLQSSRSAQENSHGQYETRNGQSWCG